MLPFQDHLNVNHIWTFILGALVFGAIEGIRYARTTRLIRTRGLEAQKDSGNITLPRVPYVGTLGFFRDPYQFLRGWAKDAGKTPFKFSVRNDTVLTVFGSAARKAILSNRKFNAFLGYGLLNPSVTNMVPEMTLGDTSSFHWFFRRVVLPETMRRCTTPGFYHLLIPSHPSQVLPSLLTDIEGKLDDWPDVGTIEPFRELRNVVTVGALRIIAGEEIVGNSKKVAKVIKAFRCLDELTPPVTLLFPWVPTPYRIRRFLAGLSLYNLFTEALQTRKQTGISRPDILQTLVDGQDEEGRQVGDTLAVNLLIGAVFTAGGSSSMIFPWLITWLLEHPEWALRVQQEVDEFFEKISSGALGDSVSRIPLETWESGLQTIDLCLRETLRLAMINAVPRRNMGPDLKIGSNVIRTGEFALYLTEDVHFDPELYPDPYRFNPGRNYEHEGELSFLGWGVGPHACIGQRLGKLLVKMTTALVLYHFSFEIKSSRKASSWSMSTPKRRLFGIGEPETPAAFQYRRRRHA